MARHPLRILVLKCLKILLAIIQGICAERKNLSSKFIVRVAGHIHFHSQFDF